MTLDAYRKLTETLREAGYHRQKASTELCKGAGRTTQFIIERAVSFEKYETVDVAQEHKIAIVCAERIPPGAETRIPVMSYPLRTIKRSLLRPNKGRAKDMVCEHNQERDGPEAHREPRHAPREGPPDGCR